MELAWNSHGVVMEWSWSGHGVVMQLSWSCRGAVMELSWSSDGVDGNSVTFKSQRIFPLFPCPPVIHPILYWWPHRAKTVPPA
jgi:hypothetical protein